MQNCNDLALLPHAITNSGPSLALRFPQLGLLRLGKFWCRVALMLGRLLNRRRAGWLDLLWRCPPLLLRLSLLAHDLLGRVGRPVCRHRVVAGGHAPLCIGLLRSSSRESAPLDLLRTLDSTGLHHKPALEGNLRGSVIGTSEKPSGF
jgi:hypothetical protein